MDNDNKLVASPDLPIDIQVNHRLMDLGRLVSLPPTTFRLLSLLMSENTSAKELQAVIEQDPGLAAKVISLSNSPVYAVRDPVSTIDRAIIIVGFKELEILALGIGLTETFDLKKVPGGFDGRKIWLHSLAVSWIARELALTVKPREAHQASEAMIGGLLHELGTIILVSKFPVHFQQLLDLVNSGRDFREAETTLSLRHEAIGYQLSRNWGLPEVFQQIILYHHFPQASKSYERPVSIISLADNLAHRSGYGLGLEERLQIDLPYVLKCLNLTVGQLQTFVKNVIASMAKIQPLWDMVLNGESKKPVPKGRGLSSLLS
ncbi:MAG: HDOD domain-containing protein [Deltaproteobacteria bacterium]|jgi:HD-like signal output (HDOD) protein|nr:HDOD domain-containing protein [Deltaproteobacteria bacterium]